MQTKLSWKKRVYKKMVEIIEEESVVGHLKDRSWSSVTDAELNTKKYSFKAVGLSRKKVKIIEFTTNKVIGDIKTNSASLTSEVQVSGERLVWQSIDEYNSAWNMTTLGREIIRFNGSAEEGEMAIDTNSELHLLIGLYITASYLESAVSV